MYCLSIHGPDFHSQKTIQSLAVELGSGPSNQENFYQVPDPFLASTQLRLEYQNDRHDILLTNFGRSIVLEDGRRILRQQQIPLTLPSRISIGQTVIELTSESLALGVDEALAEFEIATDENESNQMARRAPSIANLGLWFEAIAEFQEIAAGTTEFFLQAAKSAFDPGGLDCAMVLCRDENEQWEIAASYVPSPELGISFREPIVQRVIDSGKTVFHDASRIDAEKYQHDADFVVATPVKNTEQKIIAILYAVRSMKRANNRIGIRTLEAQFVQMLGQSLSAGMRRLESESQAAQQQALLERAFSPEVARRLLQDPGILAPSEREVSIMFADLRGFTQLAEKLSTDTTFQLLADLMDRFTEIVVRHQGIVLDYFGDGLAAFWNAPVPQPEHQKLACHCGLSLLEEIERVNQEWSTRIGKRLRIGIGVHSEMAPVGNSGSRKRLKYGPRGKAVNFTQRLESATKQVGLPFLVSPSVATQLHGEISARRICRTLLPGIREATDLFQPFDTRLVSAEQTKDMDAYEAALLAFERRDISTALQILNLLETQGCNDPAVEFLACSIATLGRDQQWRDSSMPNPRPFEPMLSIQDIEPHPRTESAASNDVI